MLVRMRGKQGGWMTTVECVWPNAAQGGLGRAYQQVKLSVTRRWPTASLPRSADKGGTDTDDTS